MSSTSLELENNWCFYNKNSNPNEILGLSIYTTEVSNNFLKSREAWLPNSRWTNSLFITCSNAFWSSRLGCLHFKLVWLMEEYLNGGRVNEKDLPPTISLPCSIRVSNLILAKIPWFSLPNLHSMRVSPLGIISHFNSSH